MNQYVSMTKANSVRQTESNRDPLVFGEYINGKIAGAFALLVVLGGFYVFQINQLAVLGYKIKSGEKENAKLQKEVMQLQIDVEKMKTADNLQARTKGLNMVQSKDINYVYVLDSGLAVADSGGRY